MITKKRKLGDWGESLAVEFLLRKGFFILDRNWSASQGEIDIVAKHSGDYYFVEVKTRTDKALANDLSITKSKKHKLLKTIKQYCFKKNVNGNNGIVLAGVLVLANRINKTVKIHFNVFSEY